MEAEISKETHYKETFLGLYFHPYFPDIKGGPDLLCISLQNIHDVTHLHQNIPLSKKDTFVRSNNITSSL